MIQNLPSWQIHGLDLQPILDECVHLSIQELHNPRPHRILYRNYQIKIDSQVGSNDQIDLELLDLELAIPCPNCVPYIY